MLSRQKGYFQVLYSNIRMYLCIIIDEYQYFSKNIMCMKIDSLCRVCLKMWMIKVFFFLFNTWNKRKTYICIRVYICCAFTWPKIHICIKYIYVNENIHLVWAYMYTYTGCIFAHVQINFYIYAKFLHSHAQKYTRVQIIHICIIYTSCVNLRMWTGWNRSEGVKRFP